jgi:hypothetical protein
MEVWVQLAVAVGEGGDGLGEAGAVENEEDGQIEEFGDVGGGAVAGGFDSAVEEAHDAFDQAVGGGGAEVLEGLAQVVGAGQVGVKVAAGAACDVAVEHRVDVVGANFEGLDRLTAFCQGGEEGEGDSGFADAAAFAGNDKGHVGGWDGKLLGVFKLPLRFFFEECDL